jgi:hypothetical protein
MTATTNSYQPREWKMWNSNYVDSVHAQTNDLYIFIFNYAILYHVRKPCQKILIYWLND